MHGYLSEFQYAAQLDFEKSKSSNVQKKADEPKKTEPVSKNPNVIGNTPYDELGDKSELQYYPKLKSRHAANIAKQLDEDGVRFGGLKKGWVTTITINKVDIPKYEAAVEKVKAMYNQNKKQTAEPLADDAPVSKTVIKQPADIAASIDKASLKIYDDHYYCFGCHATGDCTDFAARLFGIPQLEAAKRISYDFGLNLLENGIAVPIQVKANPEAEYRRWLTQTSSTITKYLNKLHEWRNRYQPNNQTEALHPLFAESLQRTSYIEYLDEILRYGSEQEKRKLFEQNRKDIQRITDRVHRIAADEHTVRRRAI